MPEAVTVNADIVTVNTASGTTSAVISGAEMMNLPSTGRNVAPFALLMPGAVSTTPVRFTAETPSTLRKPLFFSLCVLGASAVERARDLSSPC